VYLPWSSISAIVRRILKDTLRSSRSWQLPHRLNRVYYIEKGDVQLCEGCLLIRGWAVGSVNSGSMLSGHCLHKVISAYSGELEGTLLGLSGGTALFPTLCLKACRQQRYNMTAVVSKSINAARQLGTCKKSTYISQFSCQPRSTNAGVGSLKTIRTFATSHTGAQAAQPSTDN